jgi:hypothetical protein
MICLVLQPQPDRGELPRQTACAEPFALRAGQGIPGGQPFS